MAHKATTTGASIQGIVLYPIQPYLIIAAVLLLVGCFQWAAYFYTKFNSRRRSIRVGKSAQSSRRRTSVLSLPLAIVNFYRVLAFRTTIGLSSYVYNLAEALVTMAYVVLLLVWTFIIGDLPRREVAKTARGNTDEYDPDGEPLNWCSRAGVLAASQFPLITILGTKNNVVSLVTHISAEKLNFLHRLVARTCLIFIGIHVLGGGNNFSFYGRASSESEMFGIVAALAFVGLVVVSFRPVRQRAYELFFCLHFVAVISIIVATIFHIENYGASKFTYYIWPSFIIWAVDRLIRTSRLIYFNFAYFGSNQKPGMLDATTELLSENLTRVRVRRPSNFRWSPGQFAYLIMPSVSRLPFEAHPFSIASVDSLLFGPDATVSEDSADGKELIFMIGVKNGFTKRLKHVAAQGQRVKAYIDGPYGEGVNLGYYNTSLIIAGGTGITFALPALLNVIESVRKGSSYCRRIILVWSIRDGDLLNSVSESLSKAIRFTPPGLKVDIQVFLTKKHSRLSSAAAQSTASFEVIESNPFEDRIPFENLPNPFEQPEEGIFSAPWLKVASGRPNLERILNEEIMAVSGSVSVSVCGPDAMIKVVRKTLGFAWSSPLNPLNGGPSVTLHVESFGYA